MENKKHTTNTRNQNKKGCVKTMKSQKQTKKN